MNKIINRRNNLDRLLSKNTEPSKKGYSVSYVKNKHFVEGLKGSSKASQK